MDVFNTFESIPVDILIEPYIKQVINFNNKIHLYWEKQFIINMFDVEILHVAS